MFCTDFYKAEFAFDVSTSVARYMFLRIDALNE